MGKLTSDFCPSELPFSSLVVHSDSKLTLLEIKTEKEVISNDCQEFFSNRG